MQKKKNQPTHAERIPLMPPQRKPALSSEQQLDKSDLSPSSKQLAVCHFKTQLFSPPEFTFAPLDPFAKSCRVPEHYIHDKPALRGTCNSSWLLSNVPNTPEERVF